MDAQLALVEAVRDSDGISQRRSGDADENGAGADSRHVRLAHREREEGVAPMEAALLACMKAAAPALEDARVATTLGE